MRKAAGWVPANRPRQAGGVSQELPGPACYLFLLAARNDGLAFPVHWEGLSQQGAKLVLCRTVLACP